MLMETLAGEGDREVSKSLFAFRRQGKIDLQMYNTYGLQLTFEVGGSG